MEKVFYWQFPSYLNLFLSIYLTLFGHHHQSSMSGWCTAYIHIIGTKIAWKFFLSRNLPSHPWQTYNNYSSLKTFFSKTYSSSFLSDFVKILPLVNCLPLPIIVKRDPFSNFLKRKNPIFQKKKSYAVFSLILWENEILHYLFKIRMYHWWLQKNTIKENGNWIRKEFLVKKVFLSPS